MSLAVVMRAGRQQVQQQHETPNRTFLQTSLKIPWAASGMDSGGGKGKSENPVDDA
jgi:hypothetical protein